MAKQPTPAYRPYEAGSAPRPAGAPYLRAIDVSSGDNAIAQALGRAGQAVEHYGDTMTAVAAIEHQRRQEDARVTVASIMARARLDEGNIRRQAEQEAPNGWQGLTDTVAQRWRETAQGYQQDPNLTPEARQLLDSELGQFEYQVLDNAAETENVARRAWRVDRVNEATNQNSNLLAADPSQYQDVRDNHIALINSMQDITADQRRALAERADSEFAIAAVSGAVERDPHGALTALQNADSAGPYEHLTGEQRAAFINRAQAEINRRISEARAQQAQITAGLRDTYNAQVQLLERGIMPQQPLDPQTVATLLGPDVAQNYIAHLSGAAFTQQMATMPSTDVARVAAGAVSSDRSDLGNLLTVEGRNAAQQVLQQRQSDPGGYALRNGLMRHGDLLTSLMAARGPEAWQQLSQALRDRGADAVELRRTGITDRTAPLSQAEAQTLGAWLQQLPAQQRLSFFSQAAQSMNRDAYVAMMRQLQPTAGDVNAYAGFRFSENPRLARRLMRGAEILQGGPPDPNRPSQDRRPLVQMPSDAWMRERWEASVGDAYRRIPNAAASAYSVFMADYAARSEEAGDTARGTTDGDRTRAEHAVGDAVGGVTIWNGRHTLMPAGMSRDQFAAAVTRGMRQWSFLRTANANDYSIVAIGGGRYEIEGLRNPNSGRPVEIEVRP